MRWTPADPDNLGSDRLVLSEGHVAPILYAASTDLSDRVRSDGKRRPMRKRDLMTLRETVRRSTVIPIRCLAFHSSTLRPGRWVRACRWRRASAARRGSTACRSASSASGDGESREGQIWEALDSAPIIASAGWSRSSTATRWARATISCWWRTWSVLW